MARHKEWWFIRPFGIGGLGISRTGDIYAVKLTFRLDRDPKRILECELTPDDARIKAKMLLEAADKVEQLNKTM